MNENISEIVRNKIEKTDYGIVFSASDFPVEVTKQKSVNKVLENLTKAGEIRRLSKGRYYKILVSDKTFLGLSVLVKIDLNLLFLRIIGYYRSFLVKISEGVSKLIHSLFFAQSPDFLKPELCYFLKFLYL